MAAVMEIRTFSRKLAILLELMLPELTEYSTGAGIKFVGGWAWAFIDPLASASIKHTPAIIVNLPLNNFIPNIPVFSFLGTKIQRN